MRVTAIVNPKGGTGKTTTAINLAASAALSGSRVLLIDMDKQGSATQWLGHSPENEALVEALLGQTSLDSIVVPTSVENLELVRASAVIQQDSITSEPGVQFLLREALEKMSPRDWIVLDAPGDLGPITIMSLTAATDVVIPVPAGGMELDEVPKVKATIAKVQQRLNPSLAIAGVLLTQVRIYGKHSSILAREVGEQLRQDFPTGDLFSTFVRDDLRFREAPAARQPMALYDPGGRGDCDYRNLWIELQERETSNVS